MGNVRVTRSRSRWGHWRGIAGPGGRLLQALEPSSLGLLHTRSCHTHPTTQARQHHVWMSPTGQNARRWRGRHVVRPLGDVIWLFLIKPRVPLPGAHQAHSWVLTQPEGRLQQNVHSSFPCGSPTPTQARRSEERSTTGSHHGGCADGEAGARVAQQPVDTVLLTVRELPPKCLKTAVNMNHMVSVGQELGGHALWVLAGCPSQGCRAVLIRAVVTAHVLMGPADLLPDGAPAGSTALVPCCGVPPPGGCHAIPTVAAEMHLAPCGRELQGTNSGGRDLGPQGPPAGVCQQAC